MADEVKIFTVEIDGVEKQINSLKDLRRAQKEAKDSFIAGNEDAAKSLGILDKKLEDLNKTTGTFRSSGVENLNKSFGVLKEGFANFDFEKIKTGFSGLGAAMKAIPVVLITEAVIYLVEHFKELSEGSGLLAKALQFVGNIIGSIKDALLSLTDAIGITNTALDKQGEAIKKNADIAKEALAAQTAEYDRQISVAKSAGKNTVEVEMAKQKAIIATNVEIARQIEAFVRAGGELNEEKRKLLTASLESIKNAKAQENIIINTDNKQKQADYKKHLADLKKIKDEADRNFLSAANEILAEENAQLNADAAATDAIQKERNANKLAGLKLLADEQKQIATKAVKDAADLAAEDVKNAQKAEAFKVVLKQQTAKSVQALSDLFYSNEIANAHGNQTELNAIAKRQFETNKALQIAQAGITGIQAVFNAYTSGVATPVIGPATGAVYAAIAGVFAAAQIAKIASSEFNPGTTASVSSGGSLSSVPSSTPPPLPQSFNNGPASTRLSQTQQVQQTRVILVEADVRNAMDRVTTIVEQSKF